MNGNVDVEKVMNVLLRRAGTDRLIDEILRNAILEVRLSESMKDTKALLDQQNEPMEEE